MGQGVAGLKTMTAVSPTDDSCTSYHPLFQLPGVTNVSESRGLKRNLVKAISRLTMTTSTDLPPRYR